MWLNVGPAGTATLAGTQNTHICHESVLLISLATWRTSARTQGPNPRDGENNASAKLVFNYAPPGTNKFLTVSGPEQPFRAFRRPTCMRAIGHMPLEVAQATAGSLCSSPFKSVMVRDKSRPVNYAYTCWAISPRGHRALECNLIAIHGLFQVTATHGPLPPIAATPPPPRLHCDPLSPHDALSQSLPASANGGMHRLTRGELIAALCVHGRGPRRPCAQEGGYWASPDWRAALWH